MQDRELRIAGEMSSLARRRGIGCTNEMVHLRSVDHTYFVTGGKEVGG